MKNKTVAAFFALFGGPLGLHRFYLKGGGDVLGWLLPIPTILGVYGIVRVQQFGLDDHWSWLLIPPMGFVVAGCALTAIIYGLMTPQRWNAKFNPSVHEEDKAGGTNWVTVVVLVLALFLGTGVLVSSIAFSLQRYFEAQTVPASESPA